MSANSTVTVRVHFTDGGTDTSYYSSVVDATTFAADTVERIDVAEVTVQGEHGTLTLTHDAR